MNRYKQKAAEGCPFYCFICFTSLDSWTLYNGLQTTFLFIVYLKVQSRPQGMSQAFPSTAKQEIKANIGSPP